MYEISVTIKKRNGDILTIEKELPVDSSIENDVNDIILEELKNQKIDDVVLVLLVKKNNGDIISSESFLAKPKTNFKYLQFYYRNK